MPTQEDVVVKLWHQQSAEAVSKAFKVDVSLGLADGEVLSRRAGAGFNQLQEKSARPAWKLLLGQFTGTLVIILILSALVAGIVGKAADSAAIAAIVILNGALGFVQEYRAERAMAALRRLATPTVRVRRNGRIQEIPSVELVPGDLVFLEAGNVVPADGRVIESASLRVLEAILTGESEAVEKQTGALSGGEILPLGDRSNFVYFGTTVTFGRGLFLVTHTGMRTELGKVAGLIQDVERVATPLQRRLDKLGHLLAWIALGVVAVIFGAGVLLGENWRTLFMTAVSMAVAVVPEGLPAVVTIALALGAQRMLNRRALIRKLPAVEALGSVTVICSDKTGTLTENRMTVTVMDLAGHRLAFEEVLEHHRPVLQQGAGVGSPSHPDLSLLLMAGMLCTDAVLVENPSSRNQFTALGDPTEGALVIAAARFGLKKAEISPNMPRIAELPFDSERKRMTTVHRIQDDLFVSLCPKLAARSLVSFTKGGVDPLLEITTHLWTGGADVPLTEEWRQRILKANESLARNGMRVLGVGFRPVGEEELRDPEAPRNLEDRLVFLGLVGLMDPPRPEVRDAVAICKNAGIRPIMITGDHPLTAMKIAEDLGIDQGGLALTGQQVQEMSPEQLKSALQDVSVFARVAPEHKLNIVRALQDQGHVVAMTGDGVNDAPALRRADIGVAMGITGTDVSKEAASMVLLDDNFTTIVAAVEEGRGIYDNIRRFLVFSLAGNLGKTLLVLCAPLFGLPLPLTPFQILWLNLVTDGLLGLGIGLERPDADTMRRAPISPAAGFFSGGVGWKTLWMGVLLGVINLGIAVWAFRSGRPEWQSLVLTAVVGLQVVEAYVNRSWSRSIFRMNLLSNRPLLMAASLTIILQMLILYWSPLHPLFHTLPLPVSDLGVIFCICGLLLLIIECQKWAVKKR